jgi:GH15 family glucan-1,4-alpha-glucosidase
MPYQPIESYAIIGDLHTVALVGMDGAIDFFCAPEFDSPSLFAGLLDQRRGGSFRVAPKLTHARHTQVYLPNTNVLLTRFLAEEGVGELSDFMPISTGHLHALVRRAKSIRGELTWQLHCAPRFDYGRSSHHVEHVSDRELIFRSCCSDAAFRLRSSVPLHISGEEGDAVAEFVLHAGESANFVFEQARPGEPSPSERPDFVAHAFKQTVNYWRHWLGRSLYHGRWREAIHRSALTLKLLTSQPHGSLVAAPTFGLPEQIGGRRNFDYRYTWIRDAAFTLYAFIRLGFTAEAEAFMRWLERRCYELASDGALQIMYGIDGRHRLTEEELPHFEGYRRSAPVRVGNAAYSQLQLDIYGELLDAVYLYNKYGQPISHDLWEHLVRSVDWVCRNWRLPDEGIWEGRGGRREYLYSRLMCWVAVDRAIRLAGKRSFPAPLERWYKVRDDIYRDIFSRFWHGPGRYFVRALGEEQLDAACLLMPLVKFVSPRDPRWLSTLAAIDAHLVGDSLVHRYQTGEMSHDGFEGGEGTFNMCTFWYVECLARAGDVEQARFFFEKMLGYANHVGLYSEELGARGEHLGNFPQAFTHLALISAAYAVDRKLGERDSPGGPRLAW